MGRIKFFPGINLATGLLQHAGDPVRFLGTFGAFRTYCPARLFFVKYRQAAILSTIASVEMRTFGEFATPVNLLFSSPNYRNPLSEHELIRGCLRGSAQCQRDLYERFAGKMYAVCLRYARTREDASDILQEGFLKVFTKLGQFQFSGVI